MVLKNSQTNTKCQSPMSFLSPILLSCQHFQWWSQAFSKLLQPPFVGNVFHAKVYSSHEARVHIVPRIFHWLSKLYVRDFSWYWFPIHESLTPCSINACAMLMSTFPAIWLTNTKEIQPKANLVISEVTGTQNTVTQEMFKGKRRHEFLNGGVLYNSKF